jgi:hypothetical protein
MLILKELDSTSIRTKKGTSQKAGTFIPPFKMNKGKKSDSIVICRFVLNCVRFWFVTYDKYLNIRKFKWVTIESNKTFFHIPAIHSRFWVLCFCMVIYNIDFIIKLNAINKTKSRKCYHFNVYNISLTQFQP